VVEGRDAAAKGVVEAVIAAGAFQREDVCGLFDDTELAPVSAGVSAEGTGVGFGKKSALGARPDALLKQMDRVGEGERMGVWRLDHPQGDPFCASGANAREAFEFGDEALEGGGVFGSFHRAIPLGRSGDGEIFLSAGKEESSQRLLLIDAVQEELDGVVVSVLGERCAEGLARCGPTAGAKVGEALLIQGQAALGVRGEGFGDGDEFAHFLGSFGREVALEQIDRAQLDGLACEFAGVGTHENSGAVELVGAGQTAAPVGALARNARALVFPGGTERGDEGFTRADPDAHV
jgi:hypothetical protein